MAKTVTKKRASPKRSKASKTASGTARAKKPAKRTTSRNKEPLSAADALTGFLESPLVADVLAAGAAAALASFTHHRLSKRSDGGSKQALKNAAKAAGTAMTARLSAEWDEILEAAKQTKRGAR